LLNLNRFSKFLHCWKAYKICHKTHMTLSTYLRHVATLPWETKNSNFLQIWKKAQTDCILIASNFVIHAQILIFSVFKIASLFPYWLQIRFSLSLFFWLFTLASICARSEEHVETDNDLVPSQEDKPQTYRTVREISLEMSIHRWSVSQIICKDLRLRCFKRRHAQELTDANCTARMKRAKLLLQKFQQSATDFVFLTDKRCSRSLHLTIGRTKSVAWLREILKKKLSVFFSAGTARSATAWPPVNCVCVPQLLNSLLRPRFVQLFSGNSSVNLFAVYPFKYKLFLSNSCPHRLLSCWLLTNTAVTSAMTNFRCHKLIAKVNR